MAHIPSDKPENLPALGRFLAWFTKVKNSKYIIGALVVICIALFLADFTYKKYGHFEVETYKGFYGAYGFVMFTGLILLAKTLRYFIQKPEDYYGDKAIDREEYPEEQLEKLGHKDV